MPGWILAVDLGTANTRAAIRLDDGRIEQVELDPDSGTMPSAVVLADGRWRVGRAALDARRAHPDTVVSSPKARLGQGPLFLDDGLVEPAAIAAQVLMAVRERAVRAAGGTEPDRLVLTHPAGWGQSRLDALQEAARRAGFDTETVRLLPEPVAALHAHVTPDALPPGASVAVVDAGAGTYDVTVLRTTDDPGQDLLIVAQESDDCLGGDDLDDLLYQRVLTELTASGRTDMVTALQDPRHLGAALTLLDAVRSARQDLSEQADATVTVAVTGREAAVTITRDEYESLVTEPLARAAALTARALATSTAVTALYLTGGTARTPALPQALHQVTGILAAPVGDPALAVVVGALKAPVAVMSPDAATDQVGQQRQPIQTPPYGTAPLYGTAPHQDDDPCDDDPEQTEPGTPQPSSSAPQAAPADAPDDSPTTLAAARPTRSTGSTSEDRIPVVSVLAAVFLLIVGVGFVGSMAESVGLLPWTRATVGSNPSSTVDAQTRPSTLPTPTARETGRTITATRPPGYPALDPDDFSDKYCSVWGSTVGSRSIPDRWTPEGAAAFRDGYTRLADIGPDDAEMYLATMVEYYTLLADSLDSASPTRSESHDTALEMDELRRNAELMLLDSEIAACRF